MKRPAAAALRSMCCLLGISLILSPLSAQDVQSAQHEAPASQTELEKLKTQLAAQQEQLKRLQQAVDDQQKALDRATRAAEAQPANGNLVASTTPMIPASVLRKADAAAMGMSGSMMQKGDSDESSPLQFKIGNAYITPVGFMDFTSVTRSTALGSGISTNFGATPYNNVPAGHLSESRLSAQNSRVGFRVDTNYHGTKVLGYLESDFLGFVPTNAAVSSNSDTMRLRLYFVDVQKGAFELLAGQSWSMLTPNRKGLSPIPSDIFYSQNVDTNYQAGLTWSRNAQFRLIAHAGSIVTAGVSFEQPEQYIGGSAGGGTAVLPSGLTTPFANVVNNGTNTLNVPNLHPDIIAKIAFDPKFLHFEIAGLERTFKTYGPVTNQHYTVAGGGVSANLIAEPVKGFRLISTNFWSDGGGREIFGQAPDLVLRGNGSPSLVHSGSTVDGFEAQLKKTMIAAYYGGIYIGKNVQIDPATNKLVGYGYTGSANGQNRSIQEGTIDLNQTIWKDAKYGAINFMFQYSYLTRDPWFVALNAPKNAHANIVFFNLRYTLPGTAPTTK